MLRIKLVILFTAVIFVQQLVALFYDRSSGHRLFIRSQVLKMKNKLVPNVFLGYDPDKGKRR
jgi:hypothetical protein